MTRILFLGDIFAKVGRRLVTKLLPNLIRDERLDLALANAENAAGGIGLTVACAKELLGAGLHALSGGNHTFKHPELTAMLDSEAPLIRPANYPDPCPGRGFIILTTSKGVKVGFGNLIGRLFVSSSLDCPFRRAESLIAEMKEAGAQITLIDFHAEATAEKQSLAYYLDGQLGALLGTHTHVQTNDAQILPGGLAYMTDVGMTGPHESVIGMVPKESILTFLTGRNLRFKTAKNQPILEGAIVGFNQNGQAEEIKLVKLSDLSPSPLPDSESDD
jgi:metallophosphoesterase (TIGR00282 family)